MEEYLDSKWFQICADLIPPPKKNREKLKLGCNCVYRCSAQSNGNTADGSFYAGKIGLVSDEGSRTFSRAFYTALLVGKTVKDAFEIGIAQVIILIFVI